MTDSQYKWYHHLMIPCGMQLAIVGCAMILMLVQFFIYSVSEDDIITFQGECDVEFGHTIETPPITRFGALLKCGDDTIKMGHLEAPYFYTIIEEHRRPTVSCTKLVGEYFKHVTWRCDMDEHKNIKVHYVRK